MKFFYFIFLYNKKREKITVPFLVIVLPERPQQVVDLVKEFIILEVGDSRSNI